MSEQWLPIPGWEGWYEVSDLGRIRSVDRMVEASDRNWTLKGSAMNPTPNKAGYRCVALSRPGARPKTVYVHRLVMLAFVGPLPEGLVTRHLNGDKSDCRLQNLAYGTWSENRQDKVTHGTDHNASKTHCPQGHPYSGENLIDRPNRGRDCRECKRASQRRYDAKRRQSA